MRITLISPPFGRGRKHDKGLPIAPPILEYLAALTLRAEPDAEIKLVDAQLRAFDPLECDADLVGISAMTPQAPWAYATADALRAAGVRVVLGGIHITAMPEEAQQHADAIVTGEAESAWPQVLADAKSGRLKARYDGERLALDGVPAPALGLLPDLYPFGSFFTSRGCPHACSFCSVHEFFGHTVRLRPVDEVVREIAESPRRLFFNLDDNVWGVDVDRSIEMFAEMSHVHGKWWFGQCDLASAQHPRADELLSSARKAGMIAAMVGYESENPLALREFSATGKQGRDRIDAIKRIRSHGIDVMLFVIVGSRAQSAYDFQRVLELCDKLDVSAHPVLAVPLPGTRLRTAYEPYMIPGIGWDAYDGGHALFYHDDPDMTAAAREAAAVKLRAELFSWPRMLRRIAAIPASGFPMSHIASLMIQAPQGRAFKRFAKEYSRGTELAPTSAAERA